jgi:phage terminase large subunit-like protein
VVTQADILPVEQTIAAYCSDVLTGIVPAGELVKAAVRRHLADLDASKLDGARFYWDAAAAQKYVRFCGLCNHTKGEWAGQPFHPEPWQQFIYGNLLGWKVVDTGLRRFRVGYIEVPRKNGKTYMAAVLLLYGTIADGEPGAECYAAATKRDQAKLTHDQANRIVRSSPALAKHVRLFKNNISVDSTASKFEPLGRDDDTMDGLNPHFVGIDELHAHKDSGVWDVLDTATGSRRQPLLFTYTTAGFNQTAICWQQHQYSEALLSGTKTDDSYFCFVAAADLADVDDWDQEHVARKANPNWGVSVRPDDYWAMVTKARNVPSLRPAFMTKRLNIWVSSATAWLPIERWDACGREPIIPSDLMGRRCWGGLDLASRTDLASFVLAFEHPEDDGLDLLCYSWVPQENAVVRSHTDGVPYLTWADDTDSGLTLTNGNVIDYMAIEQAILDAGRDFDVQYIGADRWGLEFLRQKLGDSGAMIVEFGQGFASMSPAIRETERLILGGLLSHGGNPVLRWAIQNVVSVTDPADNIKFSKAKSSEKIDPAIAMVMAVGCAMTGHTSVGTFYEDHALEMA